MTRPTEARTAAVQVKFGPADHGRPVSADESSGAEYEPGFDYEVIDGRLYVSPAANSPESYLNTWLYNGLFLYSAARPDVIDYVTGKARVFVPGRPELTVPEPDLAAYHAYPHALPARERRWEDSHPLLVAEVLVDGDPQKDLVRNVDLYFQVPSVAEYWVLDGRDDPDEPLLVARRRHRGRWIVQEIPAGETYTTPLLPELALRIDPRRR